MDGLVSRVFIHSGEVAAPRNSLVKMTQDVVFKAYIDQAKLNAINLGDVATLRLVSYPGRAFQARVIRLNPTGETEAVRPGRVGIDRQYTYSVWVAVEGLQMPRGLQGYVQFDKGKTSLVIPESAVTHLSAGEAMVMVAVEGKAAVRKVKLGRIFDNQREVLEGLQPGEQVVLSARALNPGDRLEIAPVEAQNQPNKMEAYYKNK
jgi:HlyD family secretion protein